MFGNLESCILGSYQYLSTISVDMELNYEIVFYRLLDCSYGLCGQCAFKD